jgi:hypothetical protein
MNSGEQSPIAHAILAYLSEHPDAQDSIEGISEWWLLDQMIKIETKSVMDALEQLVARDLVMERKASDGQTYYRINSLRLREIRQLVDQELEGDRTG